MIQRANGVWLRSIVPRYLLKAIVQAVYFFCVIESKHLSKL
jgi:hypothetical protein